MRKNRRKNMILFLFILLCSLGVGYAFLRTELSINGTADFLNARWDVHFANLVVNPDSVELSAGNMAAKISASTTEVTYAVTLKEPGDYYEFTVDAVNAGTIDAMIDTISSEMGGVDITTLPSYMEYSVTYSDGIELDNNHYLKAGEAETYKVRIGFKKDINSSDLTGQVESKSFSFSVTYVQADDNAIERPKTFADEDWDTIIHTIKSTNSCGIYKLGDTKLINMGSFGTHTIRLSNCTRPVECDSAGFSQTACGVVLEFSDIISNRVMNSSYADIDGWPASALRTYINNDIYNALPSIIQNAIIDTTVVSGHGENPGETNFITVDKLYLLAPHEVWEDNDGDDNSGPSYYDTGYNDTRQLDYYKLLNVNIRNYAGAIKKYRDNNDEWWLRSTLYIDRFFFGCVGNIGFSANYNSLEDYGVSPAFRIA